MLIQAIVIVIDVQQLPWLMLYIWLIYIHITYTYIADYTTVMSIAERHKKFMKRAPSIGLVNWVRFMRVVTANF